MSQATAPPDFSTYQTGDERYINFAREVLGVRLTREQEAILRSLATNQRTIIMSGNGPGKSFGVAIAKVAFLWCNRPSTVLGTSGSYSQYVDAVWRPMKQLHRKVADQLGDFGIDIPAPNDSGQPSLELGADWFAKVVSPRDPGDLEGRHGEDVLVVIEEADKAYIEADHFDSAGSSVTDANDRMLAICNPPRDEANVVYDKLTSDRWHTIQFSTLNSHNVRVDAGEIDAAKIAGITDLETVRDDWEAWNAEAWPGIDAARAMSDPEDDHFREDLDERWYRRRAGVIPPARSAMWRPIERADVQAAWERPHPEYDGHRDLGTGVDVARSGADFTIAASADGDRLDVIYEQPGDDHTNQLQHLEARYGSWPPHSMAVDAIGEGSGLADMLAREFPGVIRFGAGNEPVDGETYYSCWEEGLDLLGTWLAESGSIDDRDLYEELLVCSRMVAFEERYYTSRGTEIAKATASKADIKDRIGRSPDRLDAAYMAVWARDSNVTSGAATTTARAGGGEDYGDSDGEAIREAVDHVQAQHEYTSQYGKQ